MSSLISYKIEKRIQNEKWDFVINNKKQKFKILEILYWWRGYVTSACHVRWALGGSPKGGLPSITHIIVQQVC